MLFPEWDSVAWVIIWVQEGSIVRNHIAKFAPLVGLDPHLFSLLFHFLFVYEQIELAGELSVGTITLASELKSRHAARYEGKGSESLVTKVLDAVPEHA